MTDKKETRRAHEAWQRPAVNLVIDLFAQRGWNAVESPLESSIAKKLWWGGPSKLLVGPSKANVWVVREKKEYATPFSLSETWDDWRANRPHLVVLVGWELTEEVVWFIDNKAIWEIFGTAIDREIENMWMQSGEFEPVHISRRAMADVLEPFRENYNVVKKSLFL